MKKLLAIAAIVASLLLTTGNTALGQTGDAQPDGNGHPNVGAFLLPRLADGTLRIICSGTLVTPRVFLTASHCTAFALSQGFTETWVTFDPNFGTNADHSVKTTPYHGTIVQNPDYKPPYHADVSLILLSRAAGRSHRRTDIPVRRDPQVHDLRLLCPRSAVHPPESESVPGLFGHRLR